MAHFAQLDNNNTVTQVVAVRNEDILDGDGQEQESIGVFLLKTIYGNNTNWKQTSYNSQIRSHYAEIGGKYDPIKDIFITRQPWPSWVFDNNTDTWTAPIPSPSDGKPYIWDETTLSWKEMGAT